jgi:hypothetical protein
MRGQTVSVSALTTLLDHIADAVSIFFYLPALAVFGIRVSVGQVFISVLSGSTGTVSMCRMLQSNRWALLDCFRYHTVRVL